MSKVRKFIAGSESHSHQKLKETFSCAETGEVTWLQSTGNRGAVGSRAGHTNAHGYRYVEMGGKQYGEHALIWNLVTGQFPQGEVDHIDHDRTNNALSNLRDCTHRDNSNNRLTYVKAIKKWLAQMCVNGIKKWHVFDTKEAAVAYDWHNDFAPGEFVTLQDIANALKIVNYKLAA